MTVNHRCIHMCRNSRVPTLDIVMPAYNHGKFIEEAIESVLMQKTQYSYRLKIGEDCSTDSTRKIVMDYYKMHPDKIELFLWKENVGAEKNVVELFGACRGEYVIVLEGDDYWTDPHKLEKQISFLEKHKEYIGTSHNVRCVDKNGNLMHRDFGFYPITEEHIFGKAYAEAFAMAGQTTSVLCRNIWKDWTKKELQSLFFTKGNGDVKIQMLLGLSGDIYFFRDIMADHRRVFKGDSWTAKSHDKNMLWFGYASECAMRDYLEKKKGVAIDTEHVFRSCFMESRRKLLCNCNKENMIVFGKFLMRKLIGGRL